MRFDQFLSQCIYGLALANVTYSEGVLEVFILYAFSSHDTALNVSPRGEIDMQDTARTTQGNLLARVGMPSHVARTCFERQKELQLGQVLLI